MQNDEPHKIYLHAEIDAIVRCRCLDQAHKMLILRYDRAGKPRLAKPCKICQSAIREAGIDHVEYTM